MNMPFFVAFSLYAWPRFVIHLKRTYESARLENIMSGKREVRLQGASGSPLQLNLGTRSFAAHGKIDSIELLDGWQIITDYKFRNCPENTACGRGSHRGSYALATDAMNLAALNQIAFYLATGAFWTDVGTQEQREPQHASMQ